MTVRCHAPSPDWIGPISALSKHEETQTTPPDARVSVASQTTQVGGDLFERVAELVAQDGVDERVDGAVGEADQMGEEHGEEEVGIPKEADRLDLADERDQVEGRPGEQEGYRYHNDHPSYLESREEHWNVEMNEWQNVIHGGMRNSWRRHHQWDGWAVVFFASSIYQ